MTTEHEGGDVFDGDVEFMGEEQAEAAAVQHAGHADDLVGGQAGFLLHDGNHHVERVGDDDHERIGAVGLNAGGDFGDHAGILGQQVVAAHARHAREAGGDDHHVGPGNGGVVAAARHQAVKAINRARLHQIQRLAGGNATKDVKHYHVAEVLETDEMGERSTNITSADEGDFIASH